MIEPVVKPIPTTAGSAVARSVGMLYTGLPTIYVYEDVLRQMLDHFERDLRREQGGFLLGGLHHDREVYVEVRGFLPAAAAESRAASLTFTHATWAAMNRRVEEDFPGELVLGWVHTHPGLGVFLSSYDLFIHRHFFAQPWQIALVIDPRSNELGFFQWHGQQVVDCGFVCVRRNAP
jgi:proteasome lid subunit RPN8/RPN11